jgi:peptidoglycan/xylan/chitin deacetylase (PgdA/CDA1 family)
VRLFVNAHLRSLVYQGLGLVAGNERGTGVIAMYHSISKDGVQSVSAALFARQMEFVSEWMTVMPLRDLRASISGAPHATGRPISLTFDDGLLDNYEVGLPILERLGLRGTFFIATGFLGRSFRIRGSDRSAMTREQVRELVARGHEVGAHSVSHPDLTTVSSKQVYLELRQSRAALEDIIGARVVSFAYPKGAWNPAIREAVEMCGFGQAVTTRPGAVSPRADWLSLPRNDIGGDRSRGDFKA